MLVLEICRLVTKPLGAKLPVERIEILVDVSLLLEPERSISRTQRFLNSELEDQSRRTLVKPICQLQV
jgi:hypothetical protein